MARGEGESIFDRPEGFLFQFQGVNIKEQPDALLPVNYASGKNVRAYCDEIRVRPGYELALIPTANNNYAPS